ncbi:MAG TPA: hypothetical protein ENI87_06915 [bacterium]|nr:hypothetical protein [bacterium]
MQTTTTSLAAVLLTGATIVGQSLTVVPAANATADALRFCALPGATSPFRHQVLIGASHLASLVGQDILAIEFRRSAADETYVGGAIQMTVDLSISPNTPLESSATFSQNVGAATASGPEFSGTVTIPTSPPEVGPNVAWDADNTVRIALTTPFHYAGGTLCIDMVGTPVSGQELHWWMADAAFEDVSGTTVDLGGGCGAYGGSQSSWSFVASRSLIPGGYAQFFAFGSPYGLALAAHGSRSPIGTPLSLLGFNAQPGCELFLSTLDVLTPTVFLPDPALPERGGRADIEFKVAPDPAVLGFTMTTQWLDWSQMATSNAVEWTVAASIPTLDMALIEGHPQSATGSVAAAMSYVVRFEHQ